MEAGARAREGWLGRAATIVVPSVLTAVAFAIAKYFGVVGDLPLVVLVTLLIVGGVISETSSRLIRADASELALNAGVGVQILAVSTIIYAIGWGPTLTIGYVFVLERALDLGGSRVWRPVVCWAALGVALGQLAIVTDVVPTYIRSPYVHGLAAFAIMGTAFVARLLGTKTAENEKALAQRDASSTEVRTTLSLLTATLDSTADGILVVDAAGAITQFNARFADMWRIPDDVLDRRDGEAAMEYVLDQLVRPELFVARIHELRAHPEEESYDTLEFKDGRAFEQHSRPQHVDGVAVGRVWSFRDVTDRNRLLDELAHQAFHDSLTGLANRALLRDRLEHALARSRRSGATVAVVFCDLDGFKMINDTLGHDAGDLLLVEVARRFERNLREGDTVARLGGDEFAIVLDESSPRDTIMMAQRQLDTLREPFVVNGREIFIRASVGIADNGDDALDADELLCRADIAMYAAKSRGRDRMEVFETEMQTELTARHELHGDLRHALQNNELVVYYQPLFDLDTKAIESFEALVRWNHPRRGLVPPNDFIPMAEETGLIIDLGRYVLREACRQTMEWRALPGAHDVNIGVNVSGHQLYHDDFIAHVEDALRDTGLPPTSLILELTESTLLSDTATVHQRLQALKDLGVHIAIDDFGTGYSSLAYLHSFPIDYLKIDRSFVSGLGDERNDQGRVMVQSIIGIGRNLNLGVVAEGIEQSSELDELREAGCTLGQGFLFARPVPPAEIPALLAQCQGASSPVASS